MELDTLIEGMKKDQEKLKEEFNRFLGAYNEDSTMRSSREAFDRLMELMQEMALRQDSFPCPGCGKPHRPSDVLTKMMYLRASPERIIVVAIELRSKTLLWVNKTKEEIKKEWEESGDAYPIRVAAQLLGGLPVKPNQTTLEDLAGFGIRPFHLIQWLRDELEEMDFSREAMKSTQHHAEA